MSKDEKKVKKLESYLQKATKFLDFSTNLLNITNKDADASSILCNLGVVESFISLVEGQLAQGVYSKAMNSAIDILYNISKVDSCFEFYDKANALQRLLPLMKASDVDLKTTTAMMLANLVKKEEEFDLLKADSQVLEFMMLQFAPLSTAYDTYFSEDEVIMGLRRLSVNDENKTLIAKNPKVLEKLCKIVEKAGGKKKPEALNHALGTLFNLAFKEENKALIKQLPGLLPKLKTLAGSQEFEVSKSSKGILYLLNELTLEHETNPTQFDVMISYNWNEQPKAVKLKELLRRRGIKVWIDLEQMGGSTLEAMANAIDKSSLILICFSQKYKESPNCRMEAEYTLQQRKPLIPLKFQDQYNPDGWLGMTIGTKLWFDFSKNDLFEKSVDGLIKELERKGVTSGLAALGSSSGNLLALPASPAAAAPTTPDTWKEAEIAEWLDKISLAPLKEPFKREAVDGRALSKLRHLESMSPEFFYKVMKDEFGLEKFGDRLRFAHELSELFT